MTLVAAALALAGAAAPAWGVELELGTRAARVDVTSTTAFGWHADNDDGVPENDDYAELFERLNVTGSYGPWVLGTRLDTATFVSEPDDAIDDRYTPEKLWLGYAGRAAEVTLGDAYVSFGRGLALSIRKVDELGVDTTVRGAKLLVHEGRLAATLVAGYANIQNIDEATGHGTDDPYDLIGGGRVEVGVGRAALGAHAAVVAFEDTLGLIPDDAFADRFVQYGPTFDAPRLTKHLGVYLEGVGQARRTGPDHDTGSGYGVYGTATVYAGRATLLIEGKAYGDLAPVQPRLPGEFSSVVYNNPPTLERVLQIIDHPQRDIVGGRVRFDWAFSPGFLAFASYALFRDHTGYQDPAMLLETRVATIHDPYVGVEARWNQARSRALLAAGARLVILDDAGTTVRRDVHAEYDVVQALGRRFSLELNGTHDERKKHDSPILDEDFREGSVQLGLRWSPHLAVAGGYDYTTEPVQPKRDYFHGVVQWDLTASSSLKLFAGAARGGLKCVSGVCRTFPPFEGVKLVATLRF